MGELTIGIKVHFKQRTFHLSEEGGGVALQNIAVTLLVFPISMQHQVGIDHTLTDTLNGHLIIS